MLFSNETTSQIELTNSFNEGYAAAKREYEAEISALKEEIKNLEKKIKKLKK